MSTNKRPALARPAPKCHVSEEERTLVKQSLFVDLLNCERQLRMMSDSASSSLAHKISVFRVKLQRELDVVIPLSDQKAEALHRLAKVLGTKTVRRRRGETLFEAVARIYGWRTVDELEHVVNSLDKANKQ